MPSIKPTSFISCNPDIIRLAPSKAKSRSWNISKFFKVIQPNILKARLAWVIRSAGKNVISPSSPSFQNLWKMYGNILRRDKSLTKTDFLKPITMGAITKMRSGSCKLISVVANQCYGILQKDRDTYSIRLIGTSEYMTRFTGEAEPARGKERMFREVRFVGISARDLVMVLDDDKRKQARYAENIFEALRPFFKPGGELIAKSDRTDKLFWNIIYALPKPKNISRQELKRIKLRTELIALYKLYRQVKYRLEAGSADFQHLKLSMEGVATNALNAFRKGYIEQRDLEIINKELGVIDQALSKATRPRRTVLPKKMKLKKDLIPKLHLKDLALQSPQIVPSEKPAAPKKPLPVQPTKMDSLSLYPYAAIQTKQAFLEQLRALKSRQEGRDEWLKFFTQIPFKLVKEWKLTAVEAEEVMQIINDVTSQVVKEDGLKVSQYTTEALLKMSFMLNYLTAVSSGYWFPHFLHFAFPYGARKGFYSEPGQIGVRRHYEHTHPNSLKLAEEIEFNMDEMRESKFIPLQQNFQRAQSNIVAYEPFGYVGTIVEFPAGKDRFIRTQSKLIRQLIPPTPSLEAPHDMDYLYDGMQSLPTFFNKVEMQRWLRPINNPHLVALFRMATSKPIGKDHYQLYKSDKSELETPEAFKTDPDGVFKHYLQYLNETIEERVEKGITEEKPLPIKPIPFTQDEESRLLMLLRHEMPQEELIAFMHESPHLMQNPDVRNFFDALFFSRSLPYRLIHPSNRECIERIPTQIESEIKWLQEKLKGAKDPHDIKARINTLLYYYELQAKLKPILDHAGWKVDFKDHTKEIVGLRDYALKHEFLSATAGYASRIYLRILLSQPVLYNVDEVVKAYEILEQSGVDAANTDPYFEEELQRHRKTIFGKDLSGLQQNEDETIMPSFQRSQMIDHLFQKYPRFAIKMRTHFLNNIKLNTFKDPAGRAYQLEETQSGSKLFCKVGDQWLQCFAKDDLQAILAAKKKKLPKESDKSFKAQLKRYVEHQKLPYTWPILFDNGFLADPKNPQQIYTLDAHGEIAFRVILHETKRGIEVDSVYDMRTNPTSGPMQINSMRSLGTRSLSALERFESKDKILIFSQKGVLKKVELPRYGLSFEIVRGRLKCLNPEFAGYYLKGDATPKDKQGLYHAMILEHPSVTKPRKLLVPSADALRWKSCVLLPQAFGLAKIQLLFQKLIAFIRYLKGKFSEVETRDELGLNEDLAKIKYCTFDLRPFTGEICALAPIDLLDVIRQALKIGQPHLAWTYFKRLGIGKWDITAPLLNQLIAFAQSTDHPGAKTGSESSLKMQLLIQVKEALRNTNKLKPILEDKLNALIAKRNQEVIAFGKKIVTDVLAPLTLNQYREDHIAELEGKIKPRQPLNESALKTSITRHPAPTAVLFTKDAIGSLFDTYRSELPALKLPMQGNLSSCELTALQEAQKHLDAYSQAENTRQHYKAKNGVLIKKFAKEHLAKKLFCSENLLLKYHQEIEKHLRKGNNIQEQLAIYAGKQKVATFDAMRLAFTKNQMESPVLKDLMRRYFEALSSRNAATAAMLVVDQLLLTTPDSPEWANQSEMLYRLLSIERHYDPTHDPRLLVFEAQQFINFRPLDGGLDQLTLLDQLLQNPTAVVQAPTGAGKTAVLSLGRALLKANGQNLVIQNVLPQLFQQTKDKMQDALGDLFGTMIYPLRFNLKIRLTKEETFKDTDGTLKTAETSIFKGIYHELLNTIANKGVVLSDYSSIPLMKEKFYKLGQELTAQHQRGEKISDLDRQHYTYLRAILLLLKNKADLNMDEFDEPNRPIHKLQLDLKAGAQKIPIELSNGCLEVYQELLNEPELGLRDNIQADLSESTRMKCLNRVIERMAKKLVPDTLQNELIAYFSGQSEAILESLKEKDPSFLDRIALMKDQFTIYLPLTLRHKRGTHYTRSADGMRTVPAHQGEPQENSKFGTILEQINHQIQDYLQGGITAYDLKMWVPGFVERFEKGSKAEQEKIRSELHQIFPDVTLEDLKKNIADEKLISQINRDPKKIQIFLQERLESLCTSGAVISLDPQNIIDIHRAVSGISATMGAPESLHSQFQVDREMNGQISAQMMYRLMKRAADQAVLAYDPAAPEQMLSQVKGIGCIIDGAGAFKGESATVAEALRQTGNLQQVGYHAKNENIAWVGNHTGDISKTGFYFAQKHTRGTDIVMYPQIKALLTLSELDGIRNYLQKAGRLRGDWQKYFLSMPKDQKIDSIVLAIAQAIKQESRTDAKDIYRKCRQQPQVMLYDALDQALLSCQTPEAFAEIFKDQSIHDLFITSAQTNYGNPGDYFAKHKKIQKENVPPAEVLAKVKTQYATLARKLKQESAAQAIDAISYPKELLNKMPPVVAPLDAEQLEMELQIEQDQETELEAEKELSIEVEQDQEEQQARKTDMAKFPLRLLCNDLHSVSEKIHPAFNNKLFVTDSYLPFSREGKVELSKRKPFDHTMYRVEYIYIEADLDKVLANPESAFERAVIQDPLEDPTMKPTGFNSVRLKYDIRTGEIVDKSVTTPDAIKVDDYQKNLDAIKAAKAYDAQIQAKAVKEKDKLEAYYTHLLQSDEMAQVIAQAKFFDGRITGYTAKEEEALTKWLKTNKLEDFFKSKILQFRKERQNYPGSQIESIFKKLK